MQTVTALIPTSLHGRLTLDLSLQIEVNSDGLAPTLKFHDLQWVQVPELQFGKLEVGWESLFSGLLKTAKPRLQERLNFELDRLFQPAQMSEVLTQQLQSFELELMAFQLSEVSFTIGQIMLSQSQLQLSGALELILDVPSDSSVDTPPEVNIYTNPFEVDQSENKFEVTIVSTEVSALASRFNEEINSLLEGVALRNFDLDLNARLPTCYLTLEKPAQVPVVIHWDMDYLSSDESILIKEVKIEAGSGASLWARGALALLRKVIQNQIAKRSPIALASIRGDVQRRMSALTGPIYWNGNLMLIDLLTWKGKIEISCVKEGPWILSAPKTKII